MKTIFRDISLHSTGGQELKAKRDGLNARVKELSGKALELRKKRDEANARIAVALLRLAAENFLTQRTYCGETALRPLFMRWP